MKIVILAAGIGSRLGNIIPKPLTQLANGKTIMQQQIDNIISKYSIHDIYIVVGYKKDLIMEAQPQVSYVYNPLFDQTNTSKSLLCALQKMSNESVLWFDGDVVFDPEMMNTLDKYVQEDQSFVAVNNNAVSDEEVKYTLQNDGKSIAEISKEVKGGLGEAVGVNFIAKKDMPQFITRLQECEADDYYERAFELGITNDNLKLTPVNISEYTCMEIDFQEDLKSVNRLITE